jgi:quinol monooxygenase YgiN
MAGLVVIARARAQQGRERELEAALQTNAAASREEAGCISYEVLHGAADPRLFMTIERWRSQEDADSHMKTPHVQTLFATVGPLLDGAPEIVPFVEA